MELGTGQEVCSFLIFRRTQKESVKVLPRISLLRQCTKKSTVRVKSASKGEDEVTQYPLLLEILVKRGGRFFYLCFSFKHSVLQAGRRESLENTLLLSQVVHHFSIILQKRHIAFPYVQWLYAWSKRCSERKRMIPPKDQTSFPSKMMLIVEKSTNRRGRESKRGFLTENFVGKKDGDHSSGFIRAVQWTHLKKRPYYPITIQFWPIDFRHLFLTDFLLTAFHLTKMHFLTASWKFDFGIEPLLYNSILRQKEEDLKRNSSFALVNVSCAKMAGGLTNGFALPWAAVELPSLSPPKWRFFFFCGDVTMKQISAVAKKSHFFARRKQNKNHHLRGQKGVHAQKWCTAIFS